MNQVKVKTQELLAKIKANRDNHRTTFLKAQEEYRKDMIAELDRMLQEARDGKEIRRHISMPEPEDHTDDYDRSISMLEMCVDDTIVISSHEFDMYVMDNWAWSASLRASNMYYAAKAVK